MSMTNHSSVADYDSLYYLQSIKRLLTEEVIVQQSISQSQLQSDESDESHNEYGLTSSQKTLNAWVPRVGGAITCLCSLCMLVMAWKRRSGLFHRLVLGMSIHLLVKGIFSMVGMAAIPSVESNAMGNVGNVSTCAIQGFVIYVCSMTALFYYCSFSIYSFVGILNNFDKKNNKIGWIEKYIHVLVHIYPIGSALYILSQQSFNAISYGFCFIGSAPLGCIHHDDVPCERGPQSFSGLRQMTLLFWMLPIVLELVVPTTVMVLLYYMIKQRQDKIFMKVAIFKKQAVIYLFALYWTVLPFLVIAVLHSTASDERDIFFSLFAFAHLNFSLFALWAMLSYFFFSFKNLTVPSTTTNATAAAAAATGNNDTTTTTNMTTTSVAENTTNVSTTEQRKGNNFLFRSQEFIIEAEQPSPSITTAIITTTTTIPPPPPPPHEQQQRKYSFNIFDGTNASSAFAVFVHDGDSDDENYDNEITEHWAAVQDHV